jgi:hypothetical protein
MYAFDRVGVIAIGQQRVDIRRDRDIAEQLRAIFA